MENFKVDYIRSLQNVINNFELSRNDRDNLNGCIGTLFYFIWQEGDMTIELAKELDLEYMSDLIGDKDD